ncbi:lipocalin family protein [Gaetbulibacter aestuarii]|uniref:Lipocalin family protein n=1 Tax=Gaetbulibacter aestuarii TaxID=1502358 RepID=A0ABW7MXH1_9FLAO
MKKIFIPLLFASIVLACGTTKNSTTTQSNLPKGTWVLNSITYDDSDEYSIKLFNDASNTCFTGSIWKFSSNKQKGTYSITDATCQPGDRYFVFKIDETKQEIGKYDFLITPTDADGNSETNAAFRTKMISLTSSKMEWQQTSTIDGSPFVFTMNFIKQ